MKKRSTMALIAAMFVVAVGIFISFFLSSNQSDSYMISLPGQGSAEIDTSHEIGDSNRDQVKTITITAENIQSVVASLQRPESYHCQMATVYYYRDTQTTMKSELWKSADYLRISQFTADGQIGQQALLTEHWVYLWGNDTAYNRYARQDHDADLYSRTPSYEDLVKMDASQILVGELREQDGALCLYAETQDLITNEMEQWYILVENGLLLQASGTLDDINTYTCYMTSLSLEETDDALFQLPDGTLPE